MAEGGDNDEDKTEEPSQKKLDDALERGDVVKSQEVASLFVLSAGVLVVALLSTGMARDLAKPLAVLIEKAHEIPVDRRGLIGLYIDVAKIMAAVLILPALAFLVAGIAGNMIQHRMVWTLEGLTPKLSKVSPIAGFKRIFSLESLVTFLKGIVKIAIVSAAMWYAISPELDRLETVVASETMGLLAITQSLAIKMMLAVVVVMVVVAGLDYLFQRQRWLQKQRMTRHELKEEFKQQEGNPEIKAKIRQIRLARSRKRMMAAVPTATVVVTNPTHYAVALKWEAGMAAPLCVAKGVDELALKIREVARKSDVPVIENPPLARALHATVDIDGEIPEEHYRAVAELIATIMRLKDKGGWRPS